MAAQPAFKYHTTIGLLPHFVNTHYIEIPQQTIAHFGGNKVTRFICAINNHVPFQAGMVALGNGSGYIALSKAKLKQIGAKRGDEVFVVLIKDESEFGLNMPKELEELLKQDEEGKRRFYLLSKSKQRYIIYHINQVKNSQLRIERALRLINNLKRLPLGKELPRNIFKKE
jgi:Bacteriocin-protection, YdeI or OmpD-Associated/Domain of unknown function (DUF1905)